MENGSNGPERHVLPSTLLHDLRTPLNQIIGYSEMLSEQVQDAGYVALLPDLLKVSNAGQNLLSLINSNFCSGQPEPAGIPAEAPLDIAPVGALRNELKGELSLSNGQGLILVVDDDEGNRDVLSRRLEIQGYSTDTAESGERALEMLKNESFDLVLLDIMMPGTDGFEVLQRIKADEALRHVPVIMISALDELDSVARCIELGAEDYLPKPFNPTLLKARIGATLEKKRYRDNESHLYRQLQENYRRLEDLEKVRDDLTHMIIHDLRTPLTSVIAGMQTLGVMGELDADQREVADIAIAGGEALLGMINDLLDVDKAESGALQLDYSEFSVSELLASVVSQVDSLAKSENLNLVKSVDDNLPPISADEDKLRRTLVNLLGNAIKFTPQGGTVTVEASLSANTGSVEFCVSDTGEGIPPEAFEQIFQKFGQVESRQGGRVMSTGLGLTFCKLAVEAHGGHIEVQSALTKGSVFCFGIPIGPAHSV
jgi:two-component system sensor histidine kinase/response regulator